MTNLKKRVLGVFAAFVVVLTVLAASTSPAHANPEWTLWNEGTDAPLTSADVITASGTASFVARIAGAPKVITCDLTGANAIDFQTDGPFSGLPGETLTVTGTPPASITCYNGTLPVPVTITGTWGVTFTLPAAGTPGQNYNGALRGSLDVPKNSVTADLSRICAATTATGPTDTTSPSATHKKFTGSYDAATGQVTADANQPFGVSYSGCTVTNALLQSATFQLNPIIDLRY